VLSHHPCPIPEDDRLDKGFVLLEVLFAIILVTGVWFIQHEIYQRLVLRHSQLHLQKVSLRKKSDAFENQEHLRVNVKSESTYAASRLFDWSHAQPHHPQPITSQRHKITRKANGVRKKANVDG